MVKGQLSIIEQICIEQIYIWGGWLVKGQLSVIEQICYAFINLSVGTFRKL